MAERQRVFMWGVPVGNEDKTSERKLGPSLGAVCGCRLVQSRGLQSRARYGAAPAGSLVLSLVERRFECGRFGVLLGVRLLRREPFPFDDEKGDIVRALPIRPDLL